MDGISAIRQKIKETHSRFTERDVQSGLIIEYHSRTRGRGILPSYCCISLSWSQERERIGWIWNCNKCQYGKLFLFEWSSSWWTTGRLECACYKLTGLRIANTLHSFFALPNSPIRQHYLPFFDQTNG